MYVNASVMFCVYMKACANALDRFFVWCRVVELLRMHSGGFRPACRSARALEVVSRFVGAAKVADGATSAMKYRVNCIVVVAACYATSVDDSAYTCLLYTRLRRIPYQWRVSVPRFVIRCYSIRSRCGCISVLRQAQPRFRRRQLVCRSYCASTCLHVRSSALK